MNVKLLFSHFSLDFSLVSNHLHYNQEQVGACAQGHVGGQSIGKMPDSPRQHSGWEGVSCDTSLVLTLSAAHVFWPFQWPVQHTNRRVKGKLKKV